MSPTFTSCREIRERSWAAWPGTFSKQAAENGHQLRSRLANILNVPQRVRLRCSASPAALLDDHFEQLLITETISNCVLDSTMILNGDPAASLTRRRATDVVLRIRRHRAPQESCLTASRSLSVFWPAALPGVRRVSTRSRVGWVRKNDRFERSIVEHV